VLWGQLQGQPHIKTANRTAGPHTCSYLDTIKGGNVVVCCTQDLQARQSTQGLQAADAVPNQGQLLQVEQPCKQQGMLACSSMSSRQPPLLLCNTEARCQCCCKTRC